MLRQGCSLSMLCRTCENCIGVLVRTPGLKLKRHAQGMLKIPNLTPPHLLRDWEKLQIRDSDCRIHQIFTLSCISKGRTPVSIKLKTTVRTQKARKIIRKAERDILQARVRSINSLLDNNVKQTYRCRSQLVSIISTTSMLECQELTEKGKDLGI